MRKNTAFLRVIINDLSIISTVKGLSKGSTSPKTPWSESASELYRPRDRHLSAKLVSTFAGCGCYVVSVTDPYGRILGFLHRSYIPFYIIF
jgi:hypothetical protein